MKGPAPTHTMNSADPPGIIWWNFIIIIIITPSVRHGSAGTSTPSTQGKIDQKWTADYAFAFDQPPVTAVKAVIAVIAHHKIMALRHNELSVAHQFCHVRRPFGGDLWIVRPAGGEVVAVHPVAFKSGLHEDGVRLRGKHAIHKDLAVDQPHSVAGNSDHTFDEVLMRVDGVVEDDDVVPLDVLIGKQRHFHAGAEADFIHEQKVTDQQGILHRACGDLE